MTIKFSIALVGAALRSGRCFPAYGFPGRPNCAEKPHHRSKSDTKARFLANWCVSPHQGSRAGSSPLPLVSFMQQTHIQTASRAIPRSEEHTSELQSLMRISYAVFCLKKNKIQQNNQK